MPQYMGWSEDNCMELAVSFPPSLGIQKSNKSRQAALPTEPSCSLSHLAGPHGMYIPKERDIK